MTFAENSFLTNETALTELVSCRPAFWDLYLDCCPRDAACDGHCFGCVRTAIPEPIASQTKNDIYQQLLPKNPPISDRFYCFVTNFAVVKV